MSASTVAGRTAAPSRRASTRSRRRCAGPGTERRHLARDPAPGPLVSDRARDLCASPHSHQSGRLVCCIGLARKVLLVRPVQSWPGARWSEHRAGALRRREPVTRMSTPHFAFRVTRFGQDHHRADRVPDHVLARRPDQLVVDDAVTVAAEYEKLGVQCCRAELLTRPGPARPGTPPQGSCGRRARCQALLAECLGSLPGLSRASMLRTSSAAWC